MGKFKHDDLLLVNSENETYTTSGETFFSNWYTKPEIYDVNLREVNPGVLPRFTNQEMVATVTLSEDGFPQSEKKIDAYVEGSILEDLETSVITDVGSKSGAWTNATTAIEGMWRCVAYGNGKYVALNNSASVGSQQVMYSSDGITWTGANASALDTWCGVAFGNGVFVGVASGGATTSVMYSADGVNWNPANPQGVATPAGVQWRDVAYGNGRFIAVASGYSGARSMYSTDGISWTPVAMNNSTTDWSAVAYGDGDWVAVASTSYGKLYATSTDNGDTWNAGTNSLPGGNIWTDVTYGNGKFVAISSNGSITYSTDGGNTWTLVGIYTGMSTVSFGNGIFVAVSTQGSSQDSMWSVDGINWTRTDTPLDYTGFGNGWNGLTYGGGKWVAVSDDPQATAGSFDYGTQVMWSVAGGADLTTLELKDSTNIDQLVIGKYAEQTSGGTPETSAITAATSLTGVWTASPGAISGYWNDITYGVDKFVAVGAGSSSQGVPDVAYTTDGISWSQAFIGQGDNWNGVAYGNGKFVAVASTGANRVAYSTNATTWTATGSNVASSSWRAITYGNGKFVAVAQRGSGGTVQVMYSGDGINWTTTSAVQDNDWYSVTYGGGRFVAVGRSVTGNKNLAMYSTDGINWSAASSVPDSNWESVAYGDGKFVAVATYAADGNRVMYSTDGSSWTGVTVPNYEWDGITYGGGQFVAVADGAGSVMYSTDGITWLGVNTPGGNWESVAYGNDRYVAIAGLGGSNLAMYSGTGTGVNQTVLTLTNNTNLANLRIGDVVNETVGDGTGTVSEIGATSLKLSPTSGTWSTGTTVYGPSIPAASGTLSEISGTTLTISNSNGRWLVTEDDYETNKKLNKKVRQLDVPVDGTKKYLKFDNSGNVETLLDTPQSPAYVTTVENPTLTLKFPSTFPSGFTPDEELGEGVTLTVEASASNILGTDGPKSSTVQPSEDSIQFDEPLENVEDGSWTAAAVEPNNWTSVTYGNGKFVAVSTSNAQNSTKARTMYSTDGVSWTPANSTSSGLWRSVAYGNGTFVAVTSTFGSPYASAKQVMYSSDGISWVGAFAAEVNLWYSVTYGNGKFVAVGKRVVGDPYDHDTNVMYSTNGQNWTAATTQTNEWKSVTYGNGKFVAVASNRVMYSTDGINWTSTSVINKNWQSVTYGDGKFVAVAKIGTQNVMYSNDGIGWTYAEAAEANDWKSIIYGDGKFVAVSDDGNNRVMYSTDAINWTSAPAIEANKWNAVTYGGDKFVAVAGNGSNRVMWSYRGTGSDILEFAGGTDMTTISSGDSILQGNTAGIVGAVVDTTLNLSSSVGTWTTAANGGANVKGPNKKPVRSLTTEELDEQKLKFLTYHNRKEVVCGEVASDARAELQATLLEAGYDAADIAQAYSNLDN